MSDFKLADDALAGLAAAMRDRSATLARLRLGIGASHRRAQCDGCGDATTCRRWPLAVRPWLCGRCWLRKVRGALVAKLDGRSFTVATTHPQHGELHRGSLRNVGVDPASGRLVWSVSDCDGHDLGRHALDFVAAVELLCDATPGLDDLTPADVPGTTEGEHL